MTKHRGVARTGEIRPCLLNLRHAPAHAPAVICEFCDKDIYRWLNEIPDIYAILPDVVEHGTIERNPESKATKGKAVPPAPGRLEIIDLLDTRLGRRWQGLNPANDRRGVVGTLKPHVDRLREERSLTAPHNDTSVTEAAKLLRRHLPWLTTQPWVAELHDDLKMLHRRLCDAIGEYRRPPVGHCHIVTDDGTPCAGNLYPNRHGGVRCAQCSATWDATHLRHLGLAQAQEKP